MILNDRPPNGLIKLVKRHLENKLKSTWLPLYYNSDLGTKSQYTTRTQMMDVVDDVLFLKNRNPKVKEYSVYLFYFVLSYLIDLVLILTFKSQFNFEM